jgi:hypothetical protein
LQYKGTEAKRAKNTKRAKTRSVQQTQPKKTKDLTIVTRLEEAFVMFSKHNKTKGAPEGTKLKE